jgi:hypothetical protein
MTNKIYVVAKPEDFADAFMKKVEDARKQTTKKPITKKPITKGAGK